MSKNFGTIYGKFILSTSANNQVTVGNNTFNLSNTEFVENVYVNSSPIEYSNVKVFQTPQVGGVEIRNGNEILSKNSIIDDDLTLQKNASEYEGATVYQNNYPVGMIQKGGSLLSTALISSLVLTGCATLTPTVDEQVVTKAETDTKRKQTTKWWEEEVEECITVEEVVEEDNNNNNQHVEMPVLSENHSGPLMILMMNLMKIQWMKTQV